MQNILVLGFGVASTAYVSLLDHNKKRVFVVGSPFDFKKIKSAKKLRYIKNDNIKLNFSKNIFFYNNLEDIPFFKFSLIIIGVNSLQQLTKVYYLMNLRPLNNKQKLIVQKTFSNLPIQIIQPSKWKI